MKLMELPIPGSGCGNTRLLSDGVTLTLEYEYDKAGKDWIGGIKFERVMAYRFRNVMHGRGYVSDAYDSLAEIVPSPWKEELRSIEPRGISDAQSKRHFAAFLSSNGYFEILADAFSLIEPRLGTLN